MASLQKPIGSGFGAASTAADVISGIDLSGKVAIVTGGYSGIGVATTRVLRLAGASVIVPTRNHDQAMRALHGIDVKIDEKDLLEPPSIDAFAARFLARADRLRACDGTAESSRSSIRDYPTPPIHRNRPACRAARYGR
jgi:hypothetical protein